MRHYPNKCVSSNKNWFKISPQFLTGLVHFLVASLTARYTDFMT
ncbi:hypothetical protein SAMN05216331_1932, partial [Porphyromonadaceae bacterium KH3R12]